MTGLDHGHVLETVAVFVEHVVAASLNERALGEDIVWRFRDRSGFQGTISSLTAGRSRIALNFGLADGLHDAVSRIAEIGEDGAAALGPAFTSLGGAEAGLGAIFVAGVTVASLHEAAHAAAGHLGFRRSGDWSASFEMLDELEADGAAAGLGVEFAPEIVLMALPGAAPPPEDACFAAVALGALLAVACTPEVAKPGYPSRRLRLLNLVASLAWRAMEPVGAAPVRSGDDYIRPVLDEDQAEAAGRALRRRFFPALIAFGALRGVMDGLPCPVTPQDDPVAEDLRRDLLTILSGGRPQASAEGRALSRLSDLRPDYLRALHSYRKSRLWD